MIQVHFGDKGKKTMRFLSMSYKFFFSSCSMISGYYRISIASAKFSTPNGTELDLAWLSDNDPETCNKRDIHTITVTLDSPQPLTWLRLVVDNAGKWR